MVEVLATGTPEQIARVEASHTGMFLAEVLGVSAPAELVEARKAG